MHRKFFVHQFSMGGKHVNMYDFYSRFSMIQHISVDFTPLRPEIYTLNRFKLSTSFTSLI